ncbi:MAG: flavin reductase family protein [Gammaproteobacteria bacterium]|jgi:flavin reductase (DIM6/NTAB) family NADH-FMN oxidoreductase RutF
MHKTIKPSILYFGTPVALISTLNEDGTYNLSPMSSVFWLGWRCVLGLSMRSKTTQNMIRTGECVLNLPSVHEVAAVDRLALTTGSNPVPEAKLRRGYRFEADKFAISGLTWESSDTVAAPRVSECPVQMEGTVEKVHGIADDDPLQRGILACIEVRVRRVHVEESILAHDKPDHVDPDRWRPLIMSFQQFYGLGPRLFESTLAQVPENMYRTPDAKQAGTATE